jgi:hypothetical protein
MWLWIAIGLAGYLAVMGLLIAIAAAARVADRQERAVFAAWVHERKAQVVEHPSLRRGKSPRAA